MLDHKILIILMITLLSSCSHERDSISRNVFRDSSFFCPWAYSIDAKIPVEIQFFNQTGIDENELADLANSASSSGKLYLLLYAKYRSPLQYVTIKGKITMTDVIEYRNGCVYKDITSEEAVRKIDLLTYDWAGVINDN